MLFQHVTFLIEYYKTSAGSRNITLSFYVHRSRPGQWALPFILNGALKER